VKWKIRLRLCGKIIYVCNSERIMKIGQFLQKLCSNEKVSSFLTHTVVRMIFFVQRGFLEKNGNDGALKLRAELN